MDVQNGDDITYKGYIIDNISHYLGLDKTDLNYYADNLLEMKRNIDGAKYATISMIPPMLISQSMSGVLNNTSLQSSLASASSKSSNSLLGGQYSSVNTNGHYVGNPDPLVCLSFDYRNQFERFRCDQQNNTEFVLFDINFPDPFLSMKFNYEIKDVFNNNSDNNVDPTVDWTCSCSLRYKRIEATIQSLTLKIFRFQLNTKYNITNEEISKVDTFKINDEKELEKDNKEQKDKEKENKEQKEKEYKEQKDKEEIENLTQTHSTSKYYRFKTISENTTNVEKSKNRSQNKTKMSKQDFIYNLLNDKQKSNKNKNKIGTEHMDALISDIGYSKEDKTENIGLEKMETTFYIENYGQTKMMQVAKDDRTKQYVDSTSTSNEVEISLNLHLGQVDLTNLFKYTVDGRFMHWDECDWTKTEVYNAINDILVHQDFGRIQVRVNGKDRDLQALQRDYDIKNQVLNALQLLINKLNKFRGCFWIINTIDYLKWDYRDQLKEYEERVKLAELN